MEELDRRDFLERAGKLALAAGALGVSPAWAEISAAGPTPVQLKQLARQIRGSVVTPASRGYGAARLVFDTRFNGAHPKAVVYCESTADVQKTVRWARKHGVHLVPRCGGHSYAGYSTGSGVVLDVTRMRAVKPHGGTATIGAGALLIDVYSKLWARRRMIPGGSCPTVGISGLTLGGGLGWSGRRFGTTADNVKEVTIVTADGRALVCNGRQNSDLYWACRGGGGGNFGVVTEFVFETHPIHNVSTFSISWPWSDAARAVKAWQAWAPHAPSTLGLSTIVLSSGQRPTVGAAGQFFGSASALRRLIRPLANAGHATVSVTSRTFFDAVLFFAGCTSVAQCHLAPRGRVQRESFKAKSDYCQRPLSQKGIETMLRGIEAKGRSPTSGGLALILEAYGGAINKVPTAATAFAHRDMLFSIQYYASPGSGASIAFLNRFYKAMRPYVSGYGYQNYIDPAMPNWTHAYYGSNYRRLRSVKKRYDPRNFFHFQQSIRP